MRFHLSGREVVREVEREAEDVYTHQGTVTGVRPAGLAQLGAPEPGAGRGLAEEGWGVLPGTAQVLVTFYTICNIRHSSRLAS